MYLPISGNRGKKMKFGKKRNRDTLKYKMKTHPMFIIRERLFLIILVGSANGLR